MIENRMMVVHKEYPVIKKCDRCGMECNIDNTVEWNEFHHINFTGGYGSVFGDGMKVEVDLCQKCLKHIIDTNFCYQINSLLKSVMGEKFVPHRLQK